MGKYNLPSLDSYSYKPLRKQVYEVLRRAILTGQFSPGEKFTEVEIARELSVSRTPVREAIRMLELEDLIVISPQKGVFVAGLNSRKDINDVFQVREELEALAVKLTAEKIDSPNLKKMELLVADLEKAIATNNLEKCVEVDIDFHQIIYDVADNKWLQKVLDTLFEQITRFRSQSFGRGKRMEEALEEHKELFQAFAQGEVGKAEKIARQHIESARKNVINIFIESQKEE